MFHDFSLREKADSEQHNPSDVRNESGFGMDPVNNRVPGENQQQIHDITVDEVRRLFSKRRRQLQWRKWTTVVAIAGLFAIVIAFSFKPTRKPQYLVAQLERGDIQDVVESTGTVDAIRTIEVRAQHPGTISQIYVDRTSRVRRGQILARMESSLFESALLQAKDELQTALVSVASSKLELLRSQATAARTAQDCKRYASLQQEGLVSQQQFYQAKATNDAAQAAVSRAEEQIHEALAAVNQKTAAVEVAQMNLDHTIIPAPIDGVVTARDVDIGQRLAASLPTRVLFEIAPDFKEMLLHVNTGNSGMRRTRVGQEVTFTVDTFPRDLFRGKVTWVRLNAMTVHSIVTYEAIIEFSNPDAKLFPGMTTHVSIQLATATDVLRIPDSALWFKPDITPEQLDMLCAKQGIPDGKKQEEVQRKGFEAIPDSLIVWKVNNDESLEPVQIKAGITDRKFTEVAQVVHGDLHAGDQLAIGVMGPGRKSARAGGSSNSMHRPVRRARTAINLVSASRKRTPAPRGIAT